MSTRYRTVNTDNIHQDTLSRRTLLRRGAIISTSLGLALVATTGQAAAMNKAELIEAMASEAGISSADAEGILDAFIDATAKALSEGNSAVLVGFGAFSISKRSARTGRNPQFGRGGQEDSPVTFDACPEFAAALDLNPGKGDEASARCRDADVVIDAKYLARHAGGGDSELSKADAKRALDALVGRGTKALKKGDRLSLGEPFGSFSISKRSARTGRNPQTGKKIQSAAKNEVKFKAGAELSKAVN